MSSYLNKIHHMLVKPNLDLKNIYQAKLMICQYCFPQIEHLSR